MNVNTAQQPNQNGVSNYVDAYIPPGQPAAPAPTADPIADQTAGTSQSPSAIDQFSTPISAPTSPSVPASPAVAPPAVSVTPSTTPMSKSETLEDQNIFFLLGVRDGTDQEKESFLDELQQVIWEDFLEFDVKLLITSEEMIELKQMLDSQTDRDLEKQEKIIVYLEKLIPDLEEIMLEKALELKEEMVRERVSGLRQYYADKPDKMQRIDEAERLLNSDKWYSAAHLMNSLANS